MREILFRGKRADNGEWVVGWFHEIHSSVHDDYCIETRFGQNFPVLPESIGQWTGRCDKNGKRIFEGDKVIFHGFTDDFEGVVLWCTKDACFIIELPNGDNTGLLNDMCKYLEVITWAT